MTNTTAASYSAANETNGLLNGYNYHSSVDYANEMTLAEVAEAKGKITRLRILTEAGRCDISYIHATLPDGRTVPVNCSYLRADMLRNLKKNLIEWAKFHGVYAKGLGLLDENNWSILR